MTKFEEEVNYLIELSGKVLIGQVDAEAFEKNRIAFFEKYEKDQQQALPVVPECVGEFITKVKKAGNNLTFAFNSKFDECPAKYWNEAIVWRLNHPEEFALAFITGKYEVEKPQLFYLKNKITKAFLYDNGVEFGEFDESYTDWEIFKTKFTQEEIDSMETGSYEKIEVHMEDGE